MIVAGAHTGQDDTGKDEGAPTPLPGFDVPRRASSPPPGSCAASRSNRSKSSLVVQPSCARQMVATWLSGHLSSALGGLVFPGVFGASHGNDREPVCGFDVRCAVVLSVWLSGAASTKGLAVHDAPNGQRDEHA